MGVTVCPYMDEAGLFWCFGITVSIYGWDTMWHSSPLCVVMVPVNCALFPCEDTTYITFPHSPLPRANLHGEHLHKLFCLLVKSLLITVTAAFKAQQLQSLWYWSLHYLSPTNILFAKSVPQIFPLSLTHFSWNLYDRQIQAFASWDLQVRHWRPCNDSP